LRLSGGRRVVNFRKAEFFVNILAFLPAGSNAGLDWENAGVKAKNGKRKGRKESLIFDNWKCRPGAGKGKKAGRRGTTTAGG
jgi:hypothetical protein